jgi:uncharacterized repeat protein (TIGR01451 family)
MPDRVPALWPALSSEVLSVPWAPTRPQALGYNFVAYARSSRNHRMIRCRQGLGLGVLLLALVGAAHADNCAPATSAGSAPADWRTYCWLDFSNYSDSQARSGAGQAFAFTLADGASLQFTLKASASMTAIASPSWSGSAVGNSAFLGIPGRPVLYTAGAGTVTLTMSNVRVTPPAGLTTNASYAIVAADGESTNNGESLAFTTNGAAWTTLDQIPPISGATYPTVASSGGGLTVTENGVAGTVGGYIFGSSTPTTVTTKLVAGGLQGVMFAVRYAWLSVNKTLTGTRIDPSDQFSYAVRATQTGTQLAAAATTGTAGSGFTPAVATVASGYPVTIVESMAAGSASALTQYVPALTCTNANPGSPTVLPTAAAVTSYAFGTLAYGDGITCNFSNIAQPRLTLAKALGGTRVFAGDQFTLSITNGANLIATATTTGTGGALVTSSTATTVVAPGVAYTFTETGAGTTVLGYYTAKLACTNAFTGSTTVLPTTVGGSVTPRLGDDIRCTITNTPNPPAAALQVAKTTTAASDPFNSTANPKRIPGGVSLYEITVTNTGIGPVDANSLVITDVIPVNTSMVVSGATPVTFIDGTPSSTLSFSNANVSYSNQISGGAPFTYTPVPNANGVDPRVTGVRLAPTGTMPGATVAGQPSFRVRFQVMVN